jgi:hypothetical protein
LDAVLKEIYMKTVKGFMLTCECGYNGEVGIRSHKMICPKCRKKYLIGFDIQIYDTINILGEPVTERDIIKMCD